MSFKGRNLTDNLGRRLQTVIWTKSNRDVPFLEFPIDDVNLENLSLAVALAPSKVPVTPPSGPRFVIYKMKQTFETKPTYDADLVVRFRSSIDQVITALDTISDVNIDRLFMVSSSPRRECLRDTEMDIVAFVNHFDSVAEEKSRSAFMVALRKAASGNSLVSAGNSYFLTVGETDISVTIAPSIHSHPLLQLRAVNDRLDKAGKLDDPGYAVAASECLEPFYQRFTRSKESDFYLSLIRLVRLWKVRNIPNVQISQLGLILLALKVGELHIALSGEKPSLSTALHDIMEKLINPSKIQIFFDSFSDHPQRLAEALQHTPAIIDPTNDFNNLASTVASWQEIQEAATSSLENIKTKRSLATLFPIRGSTTQSKGA